MLTLNDLFEQLQYGELSTLNEGGMHDDLCLQPVGGIQPEDYPRLITHINFGLINIYTKFPVLERELLVKHIAGKTKYPLKSKYAVSKDDPTVKDKYIIDNIDDPFTDDILRVDSAWDQHGHSIPINDEKHCLSIFSPSIDLIQIPEPLEGGYTSLIYRAKPTKIPTTTTDLTTEILVPESLWEALCFYVGARAYAGITTTQEISNVYMSRYYNRIAEVEERNVFGNDFNNTNTKLTDMGWV